ncbi:MAG: hypothetical protein F6K54_12270 [Okeania sp. SIO3B5]|uniref:hypothetical protein n=1 Tax=Okeania sp. SIO3B5 TaxID=2607811 RepID=UPI0014000305|nr:hypothetical protein [Okeania sp. SIO3B5]NEO53786.1 hypothetical protein [Okeania sp. SIO3B5]
MSARTLNFNQLFNPNISSDYSCSSFSEASQGVIVTNFYVFCDLDQRYSLTPGV